MADEEKKLEWMYKNAVENVDREEYLLGRKIDSNFEKQQNFNDVDKDILPISIFANADNNIHVDVIRKLKEDPLEQIKQKEVEMRRQILKNPVKLKKLQNMLKAKEEAEMRKRHKQKKKKKHNKDDIDELLAAKYAKLMKKFGVNSFFELNSKLEEDSDQEGNQKKKTKSSSSDSSDGEDSSKIKKRNYRKRKSTSSESSDSEDDKYKRVDSKHSGRKIKKRTSVSSDEENSRRKVRYERGKHDGQMERRKEMHKNDNHSRKYKKYSKDREKKKERSDSDDVEVRRKSRSRSPKREKRNDYSNEDEGRKKKTYGLTMPGGRELPKRQELRKTDLYQSKLDKRAEAAKQNPQRTKKLTEREKEERLKEMMDNAKWREENRKRNVESYRAEDRKEKDKEKEYDSEFLRKQMSLATANVSVEQRIKSKINNIQRSSGAMDKNFARR